MVSNKDSNNLLVQELFQCKLTRKGTIAPSDRQSRLRKSMTNTFDSPSSENLTIVNITSKESSNSGNSGSGNSHEIPISLISEGTGHMSGSNKVKFSLANSSNNNNNNNNSNASSITNGFGTLYPPNKNGNYFCLRASPNNKHYIIIILLIILMNVNKIRRLKYPLPTYIFYF